MGWKRPFKASTISLSNFFQCLTTFRIKKNQIPYVQSKSPLFSFETVSPDPITTDPTEEFVPFFLVALL